jgi:hypothetical protein
VVENRELRKTAGPKMNEVTGNCRRLHSEELNVLFSSPNIIRVIKSKEGDGRGMWHVGGEERYIQGFDWGNLMEEGHLEDLGIDLRTILKWVGLDSSG